MKRIISIEKGISTNNFIVKDVDYSQEKPYYLIHSLTFKELGWKTLDEVRELNSNVEDYNMPFSIYKKLYYYRLNDNRKLKELLNLLTNPDKYVDEDEQLNNIIGLELKGANIELNVSKNNMNLRESSYKTSFNYFIFKRYGFEKDSWESVSDSDYYVNIEKIKELVEFNKIEELKEELYINLVKSCKSCSLCFSKINFY